MNTFRKCLLLFSSAAFKNTRSISLFILGDCETWSLGLREERTLQVFEVEGRVLRKPFVPRRNEVRGKCRIFYNRELCDLDVSSSFVGIVK
jgi:hypothetical protein